jgi:MFS family permease
MGAACSHAGTFRATIVTLRRVAARLRERLRDSLAAGHAAFANRDLRRLQLASAVSAATGWAYGVALYVYAYEQGGAGAVGLVGVVTMAPAAVAAPFAAAFADRYRRERVIVATILARAALVAAGAALAWAGSSAAVYAVAALASILARVYYPAQAALLPSLARTPEELAAANIAASTIESAASFVGPALAGVALLFADPPLVFLAEAAGLACAAAVLVPVRAERAEPVVRGGFAGELAAGFAAIVRNPALRLLVALYSAQTLVFGALGVLIVVASAQLLDLGKSGVGLLNAALGVGGIVGAAVALSLVGARRPGTTVAAGLILWGLPIALVAATSNGIAALILLSVVGLGNTLLDTATFTLLQRLAAEDVRGRVFGALEGFAVGSIAAGAATASLAVALLGARGALVATGVFLPLLAALAWRRLRSLDAPVPEGWKLSLVGGVPFLRTLPLPTLERLAERVEPVTVPAGDVVVSEGEPGDRFYVVRSGELDVRVEGLNVAQLGPGDHFGEIALLRDVPRTATVVAREESELGAVAGDEFVAAVSGHGVSAITAGAVISMRLGGVRSRTVSF